MKNKPDLMDGILFYESISLKEGYPSQTYDYPETLIELVKTFTDIWLLPESSIPRKIQKGKYDYWVLQLEDLRTLFSSDARMRLAMRRAKDNYEKSNHKLVIFEPKSVRPLVVSAIAELRTEEKKRLKDMPKSEILASADKIKNTVRDLKSILKKDDGEE